MERDRIDRGRQAKERYAETEHPLPGAPLGSIAELKLLGRAAVAGVPMALEAPRGGMTRDAAEWDDIVGHLVAELRARAAR
ncbi:MAG: hypothetical protein O7C98_00825 [Planctomycetota bacterium]|nr:hypothetical protein [Planctomycetota bacterium]